MSQSFSYSEYQQIVECLTSQNPLMDFADITEENNKFSIIRHDVEFSVDRALDLAGFEHKVLGINTSYLFQLRNNCYNLISDVNVKKLHKIRAMGHNVGLHFHLGKLVDGSNVEDEIIKEAKLFEDLIGIKVDRFSFHRPTQCLIKDYIEVEGLINCYGKKFFHYSENPHNNLDVRYISDSRHKWQCGHPLNEKHEKIQLLIHPYSWSQEGNNNYNNYKSLLKEKDVELRESINRETSTFPRDLLRLPKTLNQTTKYNYNRKLMNNIVNSVNSIANN